MAATKTTNKTDRELVLKDVARMYRHGHTQQDIADQLGVSQANISRDLKIIRGRALASMVTDHNVLVAEKLTEYREVRLEAWKAWFRSMEDHEKEVQEFGTMREQVADGDFVSSEILVKRIATKEGRLPEHGYLSVILKTLDAERQLLGLDEYRGPTTVVNIFDDLTKLRPVDSVEAKILAVTDESSPIALDRIGGGIPSEVASLANTTSDPDGSILDIS